MSKRFGSSKNWRQESAETPEYEEAGICIDGVGNLIIVKIVSVEPRDGSRSFSGVGPKSQQQDMQDEIMCNVSHITSCTGVGAPTLKTAPPRNQTPLQDDQLV